MSTVLYQSPRKISFGLIKKDLHPDYGCASTDTEKVEEAYYDTFDLLLFQNRAVLCRRKDTLFLFSTESGSDIGKQHLANKPVPRFWWDYPENEIRSFLRSRIGVQALNLLGTLEEERISFMIQNSLEKNIGRGAIHNRFFTAPSGKRLPLPALLSISPLKGFDSTTENVRHLLNRRYQTTTMHTIFKTVLSEADYINRLETLSYPPEIDAHWSVCHTIKMIAAHLLNVLETYVPGIISDIDTEFLHNYRVAVRRFRVVIGQLKNELQEESFNTVQASLKAICSHTGDLRDLDVLLLNRHRYIGMVPRQLQRGLELFFNYITEKRRESHANTVAYFSSKEYTETIQTIRSVFNLPGITLCRSSFNSVQQTVTMIIEKRFKKLRKKIVQFSRNKDIIHKIRIDCKKVRYLLELFGQLYSSKMTKKMVKDLKKFQTHLGNLHDIFVQQELLVHSIHAMEESTDGTSEATAAVGGLITALSDKEAIYTGEVETALKEYEKGLSVKKIRSIFHA